MMDILTRFYLLILATLSPSFVPAADTSDPAAQRGAALLQPFKARLKSALQQGMAEGPGAAINACRVQAPQIAAGLSQDGVRMGRSSHKLRNPANQGPAWVEPLLKRYSTAPTTAGPVVAALPAGRVGYVEPIYVQPQCLACHGESLAPSVAAQLRALYPEDRATGFAAGDFRGVFWVEFANRP